LWQKVERRCDVYRLSRQVEDLICDAYDGYRHLGDDQRWRCWVAAQDTLQRYYGIDEYLVVSAGWGVHVDGLPAATLRQIAAKEGWARFRNSPAARQRLNELIAKRFASFLFASLLAAEREAAKAAREAVTESLAWAVVEVGPGERVIVAQTAAGWAYWRQGTSADGFEWKTKAVGGFSSPHIALNLGLEEAERRMRECLVENTD
jgi:hypothetical protein